MRWQEKTEVSPKIGDRRIRSGFAFKPKKIGKETRWLEKVSWEEWYVDGAKPIGGWSFIVLPSYMADWVEIKFLD